MIPLPAKPETWIPTLIAEYPTLLIPQFTGDWRAWVLDLVASGSFSTYILPEPTGEWLDWVAAFIAAIGG